MNNNPEIKAKPNFRQVVKGWLIVFGTTIFVLASTIGYKVNPENEIFQWMWKFFCFFVFPAMLIGAIVIINRKNTDQSKKKKD